MSLLFFDTCGYGAASGFEAGYDTAAGAVFNVSATGGPFNGRNYNNVTVTRSLGVNATTLRAGKWVRSTSVATSRTFMRFQDTTSVQCCLIWEATTSQLKVVNGTAGTELGREAGARLLNTWYFVEWEVVFNSTTGTTKVWVDGTEVINETGKDTTTTANNYANRYVDVSASTAFQIGETYVCDDQGAAPWNARLGPVRGYVLTPAADGNYTAWTASAGNRFEAVDESPAPDGDTTYITDNTPGNKNSVTLTNTAAGLGTIYGLAHYYNERRDDAGPHTVRSFLRINGTDYPEATDTCTASYVAHAYFDQVSPDTSAAYTTAEVDALEIGVETIS
jgi:hypothetical protein